MNIRWMTIIKIIKIMKMNDFSRVNIQPSLQWLHNKIVTVSNKKMDIWTSIT